MIKSVFAIAALATALSTAAFAGDSKPVQMTDGQMDQVTAGRDVSNNGVAGSVGCVQGTNGPDCLLHGATLDLNKGHREGDNVGHLQTCPSC